MKHQEYERVAETGNYLVFLAAQKRKERKGRVILVEQGLYLGRRQKFSHTWKLIPQQKLFLSLLLIMIKQINNYLIHIVCCYNSRGTLLTLVFASTGNQEHERVLAALYLVVEILVNAQLSHSDPLKSSWRILYSREIIVQAIIL